jgi:DNA replication protein DnaC
VVEAVASLKSLVASPFKHQWIHIMGVPGCGKTHLVLATYHSIPNFAVYVLAGALADQIHDGLKRESTDPEWMGLSDLKRALIDVPVLIVDDLGQEHNSEFVGNTIQDIVVRRYQLLEKRPTVITTNLNRAMLLERYPRLMDRLTDKQLVLFRPISLDSYRPQKTT